MSRISLKSFSSRCHVFVECPLGRFPLVTSSPTCSVSRPSASSTSFGRSGANPCASAHWSGMSGCLANPAPNTGYEPYFHSHTDKEHTPMNLPDSHRSFTRRGDAIIICTTEDPASFPYSGASSSSKETAASKVPQCWDLYVLASGNSGGIMCRLTQETGANLDRKSVV